MADWAEEYGVTGNTIDRFVLETRGLCFFHHCDSGISQERAIAMNSDLGRMSLPAKRGQMYLLKKRRQREAKGLV